MLVPVAARLTCTNLQGHSRGTGRLISQPYNCQQLPSSGLHALPRHPQRRSDPGSSRGGKQDAHNSMGRRGFGRRLRITGRRGRDQPKRFLTLIPGGGLRDRHHSQRTTRMPSGKSDHQPRLHRAHRSESAGISFITSPQSGKPQYDLGKSISAFAAEEKVRLAINGNFFSPCCDAFAEPKTVIGLLRSRGKGGRAAQHRSAQQ